MKTLRLSGTFIGLFFVSIQELNTSLWSTIQRSAVSQTVTSTSNTFSSQFSPPPFSGSTTVTYLFQRNCHRLLFEVRQSILGGFWTAIEFDISERVMEKYPLVPELEWFLGSFCLLLCPGLGGAPLAPGPGLSVRLMYRSTGYKWNLSQQG